MFETSSCFNQRKHQVLTLMQNRLPAYLPKKEKKLDRLSTASKPLENSFNLPWAACHHDSHCNRFLWLLALCFCTSVECFKLFGDIRCSLGLICGWVCFSIITPEMVPESIRQGWPCIWSGGKKWLNKLLICCLLFTLWYFWLNSFRLSSWVCRTLRDSVFLSLLQLKLRSN